MKKRIPRLDNPYRFRGRWYKGAFHIHTTSSDGKITPRQAVSRYAARGCRIVGISDHGHVTRIPPRLFPKVLLIPNVEVAWPHLLLIGTKGRGRYDFRSPRKAIAAGKRDGCFIVMCHPEWSNHTMAELRRLKGAHAVEAYNHGCEYENATGFSVAQWDMLLREGRKLWGFADDDAHFSTWSPEYDGGWVMVRAPALARGAVIRALKAGSYYSSQAPVLGEISVRGGIIRLSCSPVREVRAVADGVGSGAVLHSRRPRTRWAIDVRKWWIKSYLRIELMDARGRKAWLNPMYVRRH